jgi:hydroxyacyl-ACP dehydratase HTD2-like protein with hotdog domain
VRRLWAGGSLTFNTSPKEEERLWLDGSRAVCIETIKDVTIKGKEGDEKVFVHVERRIGLDHGNEASEIGRKEEASVEAAIVETKDMVFMREKGPEDRERDAAASGRIIKRLFSPC